MDPIKKSSGNNNKKVKILFFSDTLRELAERTSCLRRKNSAIITKEDGTIISSGFNGPPRHSNHCLVCPRDGFKSGEKLDLCRGVHSEINAIVNAARNGICVKGCRLYTYYKPCQNCAISIINSGISKVIYYEDYNSDVEEIFKESGIVLAKEFNISYYNVKRWIENYIINDNGCWVWQGGTTKEGYGIVDVNKCPRKTMTMNRVSYYLFNGELPDNSSILHRCDNRLCFNPDHLYNGTAIDNVRDMINRNRQYHSKITFEDLDSILEKSLTMSKYDIAKEYGVSYTTIWYLCNGSLPNYLRKE